MTSSDVQDGDTDLDTPSPNGGTAGAAAALKDLDDALRRYFDLMYDCNVANLDDVFAPSAHLHGHRDGEMVSWSMTAYRDVLSKRRSPRSLGAPRRDEILLIDVASDDMAFVKVRLRIDTWTFVDYLTWHRIQSRWLITSKGFHLVQ